MKTILVPLDGSVLAEQVLPQVRLLTPLLEARVHLLLGISVAEGRLLSARAHGTALAEDRAPVPAVRSVCADGALWAYRLLHRGPGQRVTRGRCRCRRRSAGRRAGRADRHGCRAIAGYARGYDHARPSRVTALGARECGRRGSPRHDNPTLAGAGQRARYYAWAPRIPPHCQVKYGYPMRSFPATGCGAALLY